MTLQYKCGQLPGTFLGAKLLPDLALGHNAFSPSQPAPNHAHEQADFCLIVAGGCRERSGSRTFDLSPFTLAFHPAGEDHHGIAGEKGTRCFHVEMGHRWLNRLDDRSLLPSSFTRFDGGEIVWLASRLFREYTSSCCPLTVEGLVLEMLGVLQRQNCRGPNYRPPNWLANIHERLREEWSQSHTMTSLAKDAGVHPVHLTRTFRKFYGQTLGDFLQQARIRQACQLLLSDNQSLGDIAQHCGFADQSHFTRTFKKWTNTTPLAFRRHRQHFSQSAKTG